MGINAYGETAPAPEILAAIGDPVLSSPLSIRAFAVIAVGCYWIGSNVNA